MFDILIVDDVAATRTILAQLLSFESEFRVVGEADSGKKAIDLARELQPDVILMDINMPEMDGLTASKHILEEMPEIVIIIVTAQSGTKHVKKATKIGVWDYLVVPIRARDIYKTIRAAFEEG